MGFIFPLVAAGASAIGIPAGISAYSNSIKDQVLEDGPKRGKFATNWWQNQFIDEENLAEEYRDGLVDDTDIQQRLSTLSKSTDDIPLNMRKGAYLASTENEADRINEEKETNKRRKLNLETWNSPQSQYERDRQRSADLLQMRILDMREKRDQMADKHRFEDRALEREFRTMELDQKDRRRKAELFQALFGLGSAFMI